MRLNLTVNPTRPLVSWREIRLLPQASGFMARSFKLLLAAALLASIGSAAKADMVKFYTDDGSYASHGYVFSSGTSVYGQLQSTGTAGCSTGCNGSLSSGDYVSGTITFSNTGHLVSADSGGSVWWDLSPPNGGLGVGTNSGTANSKDDQINQEGATAGHPAETLHLHFNTQVTITGIATLFDTANHAPFGNGFANVTTADFLMCATIGCTPSTAITFAAANTNQISQTGTDFYFAADYNSQVDFYVGGLIYRSVPGPLAGAGLPGLIFAAIGTFTWWRRRRHEKAKPCLSVAVA